MEYFAGLDVSMEETHVCVMNREGVIAHEEKTVTTPEAIAASLAKAPACRRVVFETGRITRRESGCESRARGSARKGYQEGAIAQDTFFGAMTDELYIAAMKLADREGVVLTNHVGFDLDLAAAMERKYKKSRFVHFAELGVLGPNTTFVHMNLINDDEVGPIVVSGL